MGRAGVRIGPVWTGNKRPPHPRKAEAQRLYEVEGIGAKQVSRMIEVPFHTVVGWTNTWTKATRALEFKARSDL